jgi:hypothetical protein
MRTVGQLWRVVRLAAVSGSPMLLNEPPCEYQEVAMLRKELAELRAFVGQGREMAASVR